jgi:hypothetical protein
MGHANEDLRVLLNVPCDAQGFFVDFGGGCKVLLSVVGKRSFLERRTVCHRLDDIADCRLLALFARHFVMLMR